MAKDSTKTPAMEGYQPQNVTKGFQPMKPISGHQPTKSTQPASPPPNKGSAGKK
jgi:hypothetical protein